MMQFNLLTLFCCAPVIGVQLNQIGVEWTENHQCYKIYGLIPKPSILGAEPVAKEKCFEDLNHGLPSPELHNLQNYTLRNQQLVQNRKDAAEAFPDAGLENQVTHFIYESDSIKDWYGAGSEYLDNTEYLHSSLHLLPFPNPQLNKRLHLYWGGGINEAYAVGEYVGAVKKAHNPKMSAPKILFGSQKKNAVAHKSQNAHSNTNGKMMINATTQTDKTKAITK